MKLEFVGASDVGLVRYSNQDAYFVEPNGRFFIVADGMGGHAGGEEASRIATEQIENYIHDNWDGEKTSPQLLEASLIKANEAILADQNKHPERADMGTTVVGVIFRSDESPYCVHVGDSRLYHLRGDAIEQMTEDHTWVARAINMGDMTPEEARDHPLRHVLSRCLGREEIDSFDIQSIEMQPGDVLLLCSDGLTEELSDAEILSQLQNSSNLEQAAANLIDAAKNNGGHDNITLILVAAKEA